MKRVRLLGFTTFTVLAVARISFAGSLYTWTQVVQRGMPDFNDTFVTRVSVATEPLHLSFRSGMHVAFVFVKYGEQNYAAYHDRETADVVGIARVDWDPARPQGLRYFEFYVDTGLLKGLPLSGQFLHVTEEHRIFAAVCRIAALSREARRHRDCPMRV